MLQHKEEEEASLCQPPFLLDSKRRELDWLLRQNFPLQLEAILTLLEDQILQDFFEIQLKQSPSNACTISVAEKGLQGDLQYDRYYVLKSDFYVDWSVSSSSGLVEGMGSSASAVATVGSDTGSMISSASTLTASNLMVKSGGSGFKPNLQVPPLLSRSESPSANNILSSGSGIGGSVSALKNVANSARSLLHAGSAGIGSGPGPRSVTPQPPFSQLFQPLAMHSRQVSNVSSVSNGSSSASIANNQNQSCQLRQSPGAKILIQPLFQSHNHIKDCCYLIKDYLKLTNNDHTARAQGKEQSPQNQPLDAHLFLAFESLLFRLTKKLDLVMDILNLPYSLPRFPERVVSPASFTPVLLDNTVVEYYCDGGKLYLSISLLRAIPLEQTTTTATSVALAANASMKRGQYYRYAGRMVELLDQVVVPIAAIPINTALLDRIHDAATLVAAMHGLFQRLRSSAFP